MLRHRSGSMNPPASALRRLLSASAMVVLGAAVGAGAVGPATGSAGAATNCTVSSSDVAMDSSEQFLYWKINEYRRSERLQTLEWTSALARPAAWMSNDSAGRGFTPSDHVDTLGRGISQRLYECDYRGNRFHENVYYGWGSGGDPNSAFTWWRNSPGHNAVMLDPQARYIGIARVCTDKCFYTLDTGDTPTKAIKKIGRAKQG